MEERRGTLPAPQLLADYGLWHLRHVDLLKSVDREKLNGLTRLLQLREFKRGEVIYVISGSRDEYLQRVYFLLKGRVKLSSIDDASGKELSAPAHQTGGTVRAPERGRQRDHRLAGDGHASIAGGVRAAV